MISITILIQNEVKMLLNDIHGRIESKLSIVRSILIVTFFTHKRQCEFRKHNYYESLPPDSVLKQKVEVYSKNLRRKLATNYILS